RLTMKKLLLIFLCLPIIGFGQYCPILNEIVVDDFCFGTDGILTIVPADPATDYNYSIDGGVTIIPPGPLDSVFNVSPGTYYIFLQETANPACFINDTVIIPDPQDPITTFTTVSQNLFCPGDSTGVAEVYAIGGVLPYSYLWPSNNTNTNVVANLWTGSHQVIVTDANGCTTTDSVNLYEGICGCTDSTALNYFPTATVDDGSCFFYQIPSNLTVSNITNSSVVLGWAIYGCSNAVTLQYRELGSTTWILESTTATSPYFLISLTGGTDYQWRVKCTGQTWSGITIAQFSTLLSGCTDSTAFNYNASANTDDGSCIAVIGGCTDSTAFNYNSSANTDNGSCIAFINGCTNFTAFNYNPVANTNDGSCITVVYGCIDSAAYSGYNPLANTDDGSCIYSGCTDNIACNFNPSANSDDGSCIFPDGCTLPLADNYDPTALCNDGSCTFSTLAISNAIISQPIRCYGDFNRLHAS
ncbi:fibronectin type III domain-containing protein, partial [Flavobacteriales bacterium]|nr:fibronectin type III domain-containing protein [Flavobacteriales bacterium]